MGLLFHTSSHQIDSVLRLWCCYCLFFGHRSLQCWFFHVILILGSPRGLFWLPRWKLPLSHALCFLFYSYPSIQSCLVYSYVLSGCVTWTAHQIVNTTRLGTFSVLFKAAASMPGTVLRIMCVSVAQSCPTLCNPMDCSPPGSSVHEILHGKNTGVSCHFLLQRIFLTQGSNLHLLHCKWIFLPLSHQGSPIFLSLRRQI